MSGGSQIFFGAATPACWTVDNTIHHMVLTTYFSMHVQNLLNHLITLSGMSIDYSVIIHHILTQVWFGGSVGVIG